jgi:hypothetical protein
VGWVVGHDELCDAEWGPADEEADHNHSGQLQGFYLGLTDLTFQSSRTLSQQQKTKD